MPTTQSFPRWVSYRIVVCDRPAVSGGPYPDGQLSYSLMMIPRQGVFFFEHGHRAPAPEPPQPLGQPKRANPTGWLMLGCVVVGMLALAQLAEIVAAALVWAYRLAGG